MADKFDVSYERTRKLIAYVGKHSDRATAVINAFKSDTELEHACIHALDSDIKRATLQDMGAFIQDKNENNRGGAFDLASGIDLDHASMVLPTPRQIVFFNMVHHSTEVTSVLDRAAFVLN